MDNHKKQDEIAKKFINGIQKVINECKEETVGNISVGFGKAISAHAGAMLHKLRVGEEGVDLYIKILEEEIRVYYKFNANLAEANGLN